MALSYMQINQNISDIKKAKEAKADPSIEPISQYVSIH
jgi:hypothetical protein